MIELPDINTSIYDCYHASIATISMYNRVDFFMLLLGKWNFYYEYVSSKNIGTSLNPYFSRDVDGARMFHGIIIERININSKSEFRQCLRLHLTNSIPLMVCSDLFNCFWTVAYNKYHFKHYFIINGYDEIEDVVYLVDPYFKNIKHKCAFSRMYEIVLNLKKVTFSQKYKLTDEIRFELVKDAEFYYKVHSDVMLTHFFTDLKDHLNIDAEINGCGTDLYAVPLLDNLKIIMNKRKGYLEMLKYISDNTDNLIDGHLLNDISMCCKYWESLRIILMKKCINKEMNTVNYVESISDSVISFEGNIQKKIYELKHKDI